MFRIALLTQGDPEVQVKRVHDSGLLDLLDGAYVTWQKTEATLKELLHEMNAVPGETWLVGNSIPSDVNPALSCGLRAVWLDAHVWEHERRESVEARHRMLAAASLAEAAEEILASVR
jgi:putative hydrolase of the HAD superfamily